jgi:hypothetical protein
VTEIRSIGLPHPIHADRVVAEMMHRLAHDRARMLDTLQAIVAASSDGSPKAQRKLQKRIEQVDGVLGTCLEPGKRGQYCLLVFGFIG